MSPRVVNGTASGALDWPAMAALVYSGYTPAKGQFCGGTLIDSRWVLTAAHCVHDLAASGLYVYLGEVDLDSPLGDSINVESILVHPDYNNLTTDFDVALLRLVSDASQTPATVVAQGDPQGLTTVGKTGTVAGWGATSEGGTSSSDLLQANVQIISLVEAEQDYTPLGYVITDNMLPAGVRGGGTDTCQGDSGGPFYVRNAAATGYEIAGVVSFGHGCAQPNLPGIYARLSVFSDWIANATNATLAPSVTITHPVDGATDVPVNTAFFVQFSAAMNSSTINSTTITLADSLNSSVGGGGAL